MKRVVTPELLDTDSGTPREIADNLSDLRMLNRRFGGVSNTAALLRRVAGKCRLQEIRLLDVGGASGDLVTDVQQALADSGIALHPVILDRAPSHLRSVWPSICADALRLPFRDAAFDVVSCSLFAHHLEPDEVAGFAKEALRVARHALLIDDLIRHPLHYVLAVAGRAIYRSRLTRHDAPVSVCRAYTLEEMRAMLLLTGVQVDVTQSFLFRMGAVAWKKQA
jgi:2-polyprenyl-3-methyl-5-hydroxy-6-metoxy-1,4-benzoquinol methylase